MATVTAGGGIVIASDWNGTLVHDTYRAWQATREVLTAYGQSLPSLARFRNTFQLPVATWLRSLGIGADDIHTAEALWNRHLGAMPADLAPGAANLLRQAHVSGMPVRVISGAARKVIVTDAARLGIAALLGPIEARTHPKSAALRRLAARHPGHPVIYVGDTEYDVAEAHRAGVIAVAVTGGYRSARHLRQARPDIIVGTLDQLTELVLRLQPHAAAGKARPADGPGHAH
jgi:phosphoglycolate phosphatase-like HAD superfamily hydrolase